MVQNYQRVTVGVGREPVKMPAAIPQNLHIPVHCTEWRAFAAAFSAPIHQVNIVYPLKLRHSTIQTQYVCVCSNCTVVTYIYARIIIRLRKKVCRYS